MYPSLCICADILHCTWLCKSCFLTKNAKENTRPAAKSKTLSVLHFDGHSYLWQNTWTSVIPIAQFEINLITILLCKNKYFLDSCTYHIPHLKIRSTIYNNSPHSILCWWNDPWRPALSLTSSLEPWRSAMIKSMLFLKIFMYKYECNIVNHRRLLSSVYQVTNTWNQHKLQISLKFQMAILSCNSKLTPTIISYNLKYFISISFLMK